MTVLRDKVESYEGEMLGGAGGSVIWRDPPPQQGVPGVWEPVLRQLMERPGEWGLIRGTDTVAKAYRHTANLRHARLIKMPEGYWEFTARKTVFGGGEVYGRYLGSSPETLAHHMGRRGTKRLSVVYPT